MRSSLEQKIAAAFAVALLSIAGLGVLQYRTLRRLATESQLVSHNYQVLQELVSVRSNLNRADAAAQSFRITGDNSYSESYVQAITTFSAQLPNLRKLTIDNATQQDRLDTLEPLAVASLRALQEEIDSRKTGKLTEEQSLMLEASVGKSVNDVRAAISNMETAELELLQQRNKAAQQANNQANSFVLLGSLLACVFVAAFAAGLFLDIAARSRSEGRFRQLLESAPDAIVIVNRDGRIVITNKQTEKLFGYEPEEMLGQPVEMLMPQPYRGKHGAHRTGYFQAPRPRAMGADLELRGLRKNGTEFPVEISLSPMETQGETLVTSAIRDITERKDREQLLQQLSGRLLQMQEAERRHIGRELHDSLGQYLSALKMELDLLQTDAAVKGNGTSRKLAECAHLAEQSLAEVRTASYLLYPPMLDELGLQAAVRLYLEGFGKRSGIQTTLEIPPNFARMHRDVELALFRVLQESLTNVYRHSGSPTAQIRVFIEDGVIGFEVKDVGKGIPADRLDEFQKGLPGKLGVGLRGMNERLRQFGGKLEVSSNGRGTTVRVTIPSSKSMSHVVTPA